MRQVDVINRLYQISYIVSSNKGKGEDDFYAKLSDDDKKKMDELSKALFILAYAASGAGSIGAFWVSNKDIKWALGVINKVIKAYFDVSGKHKNEYSSLFKKLRTETDAALGTALDLNNLLLKL